MNLYPSVDNLNSLQVVMSYATDYQYRLRCLPGFMNKKYLNRYIFEGPHISNYRTNEIYLWHKVVPLSPSGQPNTREQLYGLFHMYGIPDTFDYLTNIAKSSADNFLIHQGLYNQLDSKNALSTVVQKDINSLIKDCFSDNSNSTIVEIISWTTYALLQDMSVFIKKKSS